MLSEERIKVMIELASLEDEYGSHIAEGIPKRRSFVGTRMFSFFIWETLLFLFVGVGLATVYYLLNSFSISKDIMMDMLVKFLVFYGAFTVLGLIIVRSIYLYKHKRLKKQCKLYLEYLDMLKRIYDNERG